MCVLGCRTAKSGGWFVFAQENSMSLSNISSLTPPKLALNIEYILILMDTGEGENHHNSDFT